MLQILVQILLRPFLCYLFLFLVNEFSMICVIQSGIVRSCFHLDFFLVIGLLCPGKISGVICCLEMVTFQINYIIDIDSDLCFFLLNNDQQFLYHSIFFFS